MNLRESPIGVFDSGVGGLTVLEAIRQVLPHEHYIYLGDTARVPYGNRTSRTIVKYATSCTRQLIDRGVKAVVIACNTASAHALGALREAFNVPVFGVIEPVSRQAALATQTKCIGVIGTRATIASHAYDQAIHAQSPDIRVHGMPCPLFTPLVEEGWANTDVASLVIKKYLSDLLQLAGNDKIDTLILGCTHYPVLKSQIAQALSGHSIRLCECGQATAEILLNTLHKLNMLSDHASEGDVHYMVTDDPDQFTQIGRSFMHEPPSDVEHIDI